jgi:hypothetical protein
MFVLNSLQPDFTFRINPIENCRLSATKRKHPKEGYNMKKITGGIAVLAFCLLATTSSLLANDGNAKLGAAANWPDAPIILAGGRETPCQRRCNANHQQCKRQGRNDCYTRMQQCWNACRR